VERCAQLATAHCVLIGGVTSQPECPQPRSLFPHREQFGLVLGHCLLALTQLLFFLEQSFGATVRLIQIRTQYRNSWVKPKRKITDLLTPNRVYLG
jgi:hypothetical protein